MPFTVTRACPHHVTLLRSPRAAPPAHPSAGSVQLSQNLTMHGVPLGQLKMVYVLNALAQTLGVHTSALYAQVLAGTYVRMYCTECCVFVSCTMFLGFTSHQRTLRAAARC